jgi:protease-4
MGDVAASGGYWISMASDAVIADPGTITGSIGVFAILPTAEGLMDKLSLHRRHHHHLAGRRLRPARPLDPRLQGAAVRRGNTYARFTGLAAQARKRTPEQIDAVAQGRIWTGAQALERGLIDRTGSLDDALRTAAQLIKQPTPEGTRPRVRYLERELSRTDRLIASLADVVAPPLLDALSARLLPASPSSRPTRWPPATAEDLAALRLLGQAAARALGPRHRGHCLCSTP